MYARLSTRLMRSLQSKHGMALYEVLEDYVNIRERSMTIDDFRTLMGIKPTQYKSISMLRRKVIDVAVRDVNENSDLCVEYDMSKEGTSKYQRIHFSFWRKK